MKYETVLGIMASLAIISWHALGYESATPAAHTTVVTMSDLTVPIARFAGYAARFEGFRQTHIKHVSLDLYQGGYARVTTPDSSEEGDFRWESVENGILVWSVEKGPAHRPLKLVGDGQEYFSARVRASQLDRVVSAGVWLRRCRE